MGDPSPRLLAIIKELAAEAARLDGADPWRYAEELERLVLRRLARGEVARQQDEQRGTPL